MNVNIIKKANDLINSCDEAYVSVLDRDGYPHVATRSARNANGIFSCYFTTGTDGNLAESVKNNSKASVCFRKDNDNITLMGNFEIVTDMKTKKDVWTDWFINHFSGPEDPNYFVVKFVTKRVSLWVGRETAEFKIDEINKPQSRCGLLCIGCEFKHSHNCAGCIELSGRPFWGECPIAKCCQDKGYIHCGECPDLPCDKLYEFSCGDGENCDNPKGARIEMLKYWSSNA